MSIRVRDVMQTQVLTVDPDMSLADLERAFMESRVSGFPVVDDGKLVGVVARWDILRIRATATSYAEYQSDYYRAFEELPQSEPLAEVARIAAQAGTRLASSCVKDVMSGSPVTVAPDDSLQHVARVLLERRIHRVPVTEKGRLEGIVSSMDLVRAAAESGGFPE